MSGECGARDHIFQFLLERVGNVAVCGRLNVNVALNRPTFMVSTYYSASYGGDYLASRAVDGNADPVADKLDNSCFVSNRHNNPLVWCGMSEICLKLKVLAKIDFIVFLACLGVK